MSTTHTLQSDRSNTSCPQNSPLPKSTYNSSNSTNSSKERARSVYQRNFSMHVPRKPKAIISIIPNGQKISPENNKRLFCSRPQSIKNFQNHLLEAQRTIATLTAENRALQTLQQRQAIALSRYEVANAELPKLLNSHAEEVRVWEIKYRNLNNIHKELTERLQKKEVLLQALADQNKYFTQLNKSKYLEQRQKLTEELEDLNAKLEQKDKELKQAVWRLQAEIKYIKQLMVREQEKGRDYVIQLEKSRLELGAYKKLEDALNEQQQQDQPTEKNALTYIKEKPELTEISTATDTDNVSYSNVKQIKKLQFPNPKPVRKNSGEKKVHFQKRLPTVAQAKRRLDRADAPIIVRNKSNLSRLSKELAIDNRNVEHPSESTLSVDLYSVKSSEDEQSKNKTSIITTKTVYGDEATNSESARSLEPPTTDGSITEEDYGSNSFEGCIQLNRELEEYKQKMEERHEEWTRRFDERSHEMNSQDEPETLKIEEIENTPAKECAPISKIDKLLATLKDNDKIPEIK